ncbi:DNA polymerase/3'-5' exonuclease PolX [Domibacillus enclensis]|uniref:DNA-directed DNA polymerase n=1 Tax=Domibacillus enclensis TaxID=1017273 RepID=A0A1N6Q4Q2_9BACI|nr:DNA polymerase/3'-5' exonuclease PolX [Domibacillus enclensis]OXS80585.1 DNA polymerase/3'-5' exonuclease PolX [Domibacillus enclensis]SIQ11510.1 DNA polymerase (family 10) [Domibacillus enclensis]
MVNKKDIIRLLEKIAVYMELKGDNPFKISAFRKAAAALEQDDRSLSEIEDVTKLSGIGKGTAAVIAEYIETGESTVLTELSGEVPEGLVALLGLPGLGGKKIAKLYKELGITNMVELKEACEQHKVQALAGFGAKTEEKILAAVQKAGTQPDRLPIMYVLPIAEQIERYVNECEDIVRYSRAGSLRRLRETVKDLDFIVASEKPERAKEHLLAMDGIKEIIAAGPTKVSVIIDGEFDLSIDFRIVEPEQFASTLHHFTGSKDHNVKIRQIAKERNEKVSEYGIEQPDGTVQTFEDEAALYHHLGLPFFPPEIREDGTETDHYEESTLIELTDIKGDLHMHTAWSDGAFSIEEMIEACRARGYEYMAITDHSYYLKVANGLSAERLLRQNEEIKEWNAKFTDIEILSGIEMDILPDGTLDYEDDVLKQLDFVIASIHSSFSQPQEQIMERLKTALYNPYVKLIAHPTGRIIGRRDGYSVDMEELIRLAAETNTALELNANPHRLDLSAVHLKMAQEAGAKLMINTDAHAIEHLEFMETGASAGRKGWLRPETVVNTWPKAAFMSFIRSL